MGNHTEETAREMHKAHAREVAAAKPPEIEVEGEVRVLAKTTGGVADTATTLPNEWYNCPLRLLHEADNAKEHAHVTPDSTTQACFMQVQVDSTELEDFEMVVGDDTQVPKEPALAQPSERAAGDVQVETAPGTTELFAFTNAFQVE